MKMNNSYAKTRVNINIINITAKNTKPKLLKTHKINYPNNLLKHIGKDMM